MLAVQAPSFENVLRSFEDMRSRNAPRRYHVCVYVCICRSVFFNLSTIILKIMKLTPEGIPVIDILHHIHVDP